VVAGLREMIGEEGPSSSSTSLQQLDRLLLDLVGVAEAAVQLLAEIGPARHRQ
jgi:hypothetical protein